MSRKTSKLVRIPPTPHEQLLNKGLRALYTLPAQQSAVSLTASQLLKCQLLHKNVPL